MPNKTLNGPGTWVSTVSEIAGPIQKLRVVAVPYVHFCFLLLSLIPKNKKRSCSQVKSALVLQSISIHGGHGSHFPFEQGGCPNEAQVLVPGLSYFFDIISLMVQSKCGSWSPGTLLLSFMIPKNINQRSCSQVKRALVPQIQGVPFHIISFHFISFYFPSSGQPPPRDSETRNSSDPWISRT